MIVHSEVDRVWTKLSRCVLGHIISSYDSRITGRESNRLFLKYNPALLSLKLTYFGW
jgi:hypothetical protein